MTGGTVITCPCGGHALTLAPDKPPVGGRAAFTCPACGMRRTFTRTATGAVFEDAGKALGAPSPAPAAGQTPEVTPLPDPRPVPPGARLILVALGDAPWRQALDAAFPAPAWHALDAAPEPDQNRADVAGLLPAMVVATDGPAARELLDAVGALTGRQRERLAVFLVGEFTEGDATAAFAAGADAVLDGRVAENIAGRLAAAWERRSALPSLFTAP
ncbi:hypothetical protein DesfrDRAFT_3370 [Solidesulfovibrio fructosivorans JJ]]|uniref:Uncharacterized protein n=1 Tax=Solidesulfovibrio fructosivorans JJ] TaxID=596151 RepID=E1K0H0_SOLFR|nr:hypothetical protein [Solidesulfovibrio fructosivorans]EFL49913.1 hypothetical protein DesfrDRAFT_3370 [Solidesulfovibrio fructosivorans JJ]]